MRGHGSQEILLILLSFLLFNLFMYIRVAGVFLNHSDLFFPNGLGAFFKLNVEFFKLISIVSNSSTTWIWGVNSFEATLWNILVNQVVIKSHSFTVLFNRHSFDISILHCLLLLLFKNNVLLPTLLYT